MIDSNERFLMRKIINPFTGIEGYNCFACSPNNDHGLRMEFFEDGNDVAAIWEPDGHFQGYGKILHGGIQATLMDEIASWYIYVKRNTAGVTSAIDVRYIKPVYTDRGAIEIRARLKEIRQNIMVISAELKDKSGFVCTVAAVTYFTYPEKTARTRLHYPGRDAFFEK